MELNANTQNVIRFIDIGLPKTKVTTEETEISEDALESLDKFLGIANDQ